MVTLDVNKRGRQLDTLEKNRKKLSSYNYSMLRGWTINWEFMGKGGSRNFKLNLLDRIKKSK